MYKKNSIKEIDLVKGEIVFVKTKPIKGWVYVETIGHISGYAPINCLQPILLETNSPEIRERDIAVGMRPRSSHSIRRSLFF